MKRVREILILVSLLVSGLVLAGCSSTPTPAPAPPPAPAPEPLPAPAPAPAPEPVPEPVPEPAQGFNVGDRALDFQLQSLNGEIVALSDLRGSPVMLNFWATWCGPCQAEVAFIQQVFEDEELADQGLVILTVNIGETSSRVKQFMEHFGLSFHVLLDKDTGVAKNYNVRGIPTTFFIDKNGIIKDMKIGAFLSRAELDGRLDNLMIDGD